MLIEFSVTNFRSFREKQTFSMVAAPRLRKRENVFKPPVKGEKLPDLLKVAAIYGPNASGKSNLIKALQIVSTVVMRQPAAQPSPFPVSPFRFDPDLLNQPSCIELHFIHVGMRYVFELALTQDRIVEERLIMFPMGKQSLLYERKHEENGDTYVFGQLLEGGSDLHEVWKKSTGPNVLFISQAVANSSEELTQLRQPFSWLQGGMLVLTGKMEEWADISQRIAEKNTMFAEKISSFLQDIDVPVSNMRFEISDSPLNNSIGLLRNGPKETVKTSLKTIFIHKTVLGEAEFDFQEESEGTKNLVGFWFPWMLYNKSNQFSKENLTLVIDEFDSILHPDIVATLIAKHLAFDSSAQLIFTTHDTHLMDTKLLRRDQFWLTERDANGATQLRSIHDFEGREGEDLEKRYYEGRYRALPIIRRS